MRTHRAPRRPYVRVPPCIALGVLALTLLSTAPSRADGVVQISFRDHFNDDVIINGTSGDYDTEMGTIEGDWAFATDSAAAGSGCTDGLPDDGVFPAHDNHPEVRLGWDQGDDGLNAWVSTLVTESIEVAVPHFKYDAIDLFAVGAYTPVLAVTLNYSSGSSVTYTDIKYPSWFDPTFGPGFYDLINSRDRARLVEGSFDCENSDNPAIVGRSFPADPTRTLVSIALERTDIKSGSWLTVLGAVGSLARTVTNYDLGSHFNVDVVSTQDGEPCDIDSTFDTIEGNYLPATQAVQNCINPQYHALPNDGLFPAAAVRPEFDLGFSNLDNGVNARQTDNTGDQFTIDVPNASLDEFHLFAISAGGGTDFDVELQYSTGSPESIPAQVPDWITDPPWASPEIYFLTQDLAGHYLSEDTWQISILDAAMIGVRVPVDRHRTLAAVVIDRPAATGPEGELAFPLLSIYGASGVVTSGLLFYDGFEWEDLKNWSNF